MNENLLKKIVRDAVKEELQPVERRLDQKFSLFRGEIVGSIREMFREFRDEMIIMKDEIVGELKAVREEQTMLNQRTAQINEVDDRVERLEAIHPLGKHITA